MSHMTLYLVAILPLETCLYHFYQEIDFHSDGRCYTPILSIPPSEFRCNYMDSLRMHISVTMDGLISNSNVICGFIKIGHTLLAISRANSFLFRLVNHSYGNKNFKFARLSLLSMWIKKKDFLCAFDFF